MKREETRAFWLGLLLALLVARGLRALLSTLFYESLVTLKLNESAFWTLALLATALAPLLPRRATWIAVLATGIAATVLPFARFTDGYVPIAALASAAGLVALIRTGSLAGALVGFALDGAILLLGRSVDPVPAFALLGIAAAALLLGWRPFKARERAPRGWTAGAAAGALLAVELAFLANPYAVGRWVGLAAWVAALASGAGLTLGATRMRHVGWWIWIVAGVGLLDLAFLRSPLVFFSLFFVQMGLGAAASRLGPHLAAPDGAIAFAALFAPLTFLLLYFPTPLGLPEWTALVPLLTLLALIPAIFEKRPKRAHAWVGNAPAAAIVGIVILAALWPSPLAKANDEDIVVVTWNVHQAFGNRGALDPAIYAEVLRDIDPDIVMLQESDTTRLSSGGVDIVRYLADELHMRAAYGRSGAAILSRYPFLPAEEAEEGDWTFEIGLDVNGTTLWAHSVHVARGRYAMSREAQVEAIVTDPHSGAHIVAGDLNFCARAQCASRSPDPGAMNPLYERLTQRYQDAWLESGHSLDDPAGRTHGGPPPQRRIDHILVEGVDVVDMRVAFNARSQLASDHYPVVATVRLRDA